MKYPLLNKRSNPYNKLNEFVQKEKEKGLRLLITFKVIKSLVIKQLNEEQHSEEDIQNSMAQIDSKSIELAKQIFIKCRDSPSEQEIQTIAEEIIKTFNDDNTQNNADNFTKTTSGV